MSEPVVPAPAPSHPAPPHPAAQPVRRHDVLGIIALVIALIGLVPSLVVFVIGLIPEMNAIWWLFLVLIPLMLTLGIIAVVLAAVGLFLSVRMVTRRWASITSLVLGILMILPAALIYLPSLFS